MVHELDRYAKCLRVSPGTGAWQGCLSVLFSFKFIEMHVLYTCSAGFFKFQLCVGCSTIMFEVILEEITRKRETVGKKIKFQCSLSDFSKITVW